MVSDFDTVSVLTDYIRQPMFQYNCIIIKILIPPRVSETMLSWCELLLSKHFTKPELSSDNESVDNIIKFFEHWSAPDMKLNDGSCTVDDVKQEVRALYDSDPPFNIQSPNSYIT